MNLRSRIVFSMLIVFLLYASLLTISRAIGAEQAPQINWMTYQSSLEQAKTKDKNILLYASTDWCRYCKKMKTETFRDPQVIAFINNNFLPVSINVDESMELAKKFKIAALPTLILINPQQQIIDTYEGYHASDVLLGKMETSINNHKQTSRENNPSTNPTITGNTKEEACTEDSCSIPPANLQNLTGTTQPTQGDTVSGNGYIESSVMQFVLEYKNWVLIAAGFWLFGILMAFTPCVLPLILLIAGFLGGRTGEITHQKTVLLSLTYVMALAVTYAGVGMATALFGIYLQSYFQNQWAIGIFSLLIAILALSMLGFFKIKLPQGLQHKISRQHKFKPQYHYVEVAIMGVLATLIASPCIAAPLVTVLGYVGSSGNAALGSLALFFLGIGIGTPLILATVFSKELLPQSLKWQHSLKVLFGLTMLGVAIWIASEIISSDWILLVWSAFLVFVANYMLSIKSMHGNDAFSILWKTIIVMVLLYGLALFLNHWVENRNLLHSHSAGTAEQSCNIDEPAAFTQVKNIKQLDTEIALAAKGNMPILLYFTSKWCKSCIEVQTTIFDNKNNTKLLANLTLLKVDLSNAGSDTYEIARQYHVNGAPEILFINANGELSRHRIAGLVDQDQFSRVVMSVLSEKRTKEGKP